MRCCVDMLAVRSVTAMVGLGAILAGCSDIYYDRRETILFGAGDAVASNIAVQTIDPWPPSSVDRRAPANGERVAAAIKRYRTGRVFIPTGNATSSSYQQQQQQQQQMMSLDPQPTTSAGAGAGAIATSNGVQVK
jgi:hypothetical protein